jgi:hypothetical protein
MKQFLLKLDQEHKFGLLELDEHHLFVPGGDDKVIELIQNKVDALLDENSFQPEIRDPENKRTFNSNTTNTTKRNSGIQSSKKKHQKSDQ